MKKEELILQGDTLTRMIGWRVQLDHKNSGIGDASDQFGYITSSASPLLTFRKTKSKHQYDKTTDNAL